MFVRTALVVFKCKSVFVLGNEDSVTLIYLALRCNGWAVGIPARQAEIKPSMMAAGQGSNEYTQVI